MASHPDLAAEQAYIDNAYRSLERSREDGVPAYVVLHDSTLAELASARPSTLEALAGIRGIGPSKLEAYGPALIAIFAADRNA